MGKGDKKSRKGKIAMGSFGKSRPHNVKKVVAAVPLKKEKEKEKETEAAPKAEKAKKPSA
jgi:30S ribosomal protein S31